MCTNPKEIEHNAIGMSREDIIDVLGNSPGVLNELKRNHLMGEEVCTSCAELIVDVLDEGVCPIGSHLVFGTESYPEGFGDTTDQAASQHIHDCTACNAKWGIFEDDPLVVAARTLMR